MKAFFASFVAMILCLSFGISASAQTRALGAHKLVLDDGAGNTITIQTPSSGWTGNIPFQLAVPPAGNPLAGFVNAGTLANQILYWNTTNNDWEAETMAALGGITGTGTNGTIPLWTGTSTQGNSALTDDGTTLSYGHAHINSATDYQIGTNTVLSTVGSANIFVGVGAGTGNTGSDEAAIGSNALHNSNSGINNTAVGSGAMQSNTTGQFNVAVGMDALQNENAGSNNIAIGETALQHATGGSNNTVIGTGSMWTATVTGGNNTTVGEGAGNAIVSGSGITLLGQGANVGSDPLTNATAIGFGATVNAANTIQLGNSGVGAVNTSGAYNTATGYQVSGAATSGNYLRGNGTNFVSSSLNGADLSAGSVTVAKISATGTAGSTTFLRGDGSWATPSGGSGSAPGLYDHNSVRLGTILSIGGESVDVLTSTGYIVTILMDPDAGGNDFPGAQIYWTGAGCSGTPYLNDGEGGTGGDKRYSKLTCYSSHSGSLYSMSSPNTNGVSTSGSFTAATIENPDCQASAGTDSGWALTSITLTTAGLPTIAYPLTIQ